MTTPGGHMARTDTSPFRSDVLEGRVAVVTGGATGLGLETCRVLGRHGARVALCSRKESNLAQAVASLREEGIDAMYSVCDVRQAEAVAAAVQSVLASYGRLDLLVNNAAGNFPALIADLSPNGFKAVVDIDLVGTFNVSKAVYEGWMRVNRLGFDAGFIVEASPAGTPGFERSRWSRSRRAGVPI